MTNIRFSKDYLQKALQNTRWSEIIDVAQSVMNDIQVEIIDRIKLRSVVDQINPTELADLAVEFGFDKPFPAYDGYTSTLTYLTRQVSLIVPRIKAKTTQLSYQYIMYIFQILGFVYPMGYDEIGDVFTIHRDGNRDFDQSSILLHFDQDLAPILYYNPGPVPADAVPTGLPAPFFDTDPATTVPFSLLYFDVQTLDEYTTHFLFQFYHRFIESVEEFRSVNTMRALLDTVLQTKRIQDIPHFQARLDIPVKLNNTEVDVTWKSEDQTLTATQKSILINATPYYAEPIDLSVISKIQFGMGVRTTIDSSITGCLVPIEFYPGQSVIDIPTWYNFLTTQTATNLEIEEKILDQFQKWFGTDFGINGFTEVAFFDQWDVCIVYSTFPKINFDPRMFSSVYFKITAT